MERKNYMLKRVSILLFGVAALVPGGAQAFPVASTPKGVASEVLQVRGFCGLGFHRDISGACVRNGMPYGYLAPAPVVVAPLVVVAPPPVVIPRVCPFGYVWAPAYGRCVLP
jgi:hypothetical protein